MGRDPRLERAVMSEMAFRDRRVEGRRWRRRSHLGRHDAAPPRVDPAAEVLRSLGSVLGAVPELALRLGRRAVASSGWRR
jgi:hypothetical protein